jgi:hypothetical protein
LVTFWEACRHPANGSAVPRGKHQKGGWHVPKGGVNLALDEGGGHSAAGEAVVPKGGGGGRGREALDSAGCHRGEEHRHSSSEPHHSVRATGVFS